MVSHPDEVLQLVKTAAQAAPATTWCLLGFISGQRNALAGRSAFTWNWSGGDGSLRTVSVSVRRCPNDSNTISQRRDHTWLKV